MVPQDEEIKMLEWASMRARHDHREAAAAPPDTEHFEQPPVRKSPIALALGGGAARGWAHIGVLRALDEAGIEISMIAGTSIGALVGGCYLAGKLDQLEEFARSLTKRRMFGLLTTLQVGAGSQLVPVACPIALVPEEQIAEPGYGLVMSEDPGAASYREILDMALESDFCRLRR